MLIIIRKCKHGGQDKLHGKGKGSTEKPIYRCTVCMAETTATT